MAHQPVDAALKPIAELIVDLYARQIALQALVVETGIEKKRVDDTIQKARAHVQQIPVVANLQRQTDARQLESLARVMPTVRWPKDH